MKRRAPVIALLLLAPFVGEFLLGNISLREIFALPFLVPLYGAGALLIREVARRTGRGWPTILLLGAAYGVIEAGLVDQSLFNPSLDGWDFLAVTPVPALGISAWHAMSFVMGHAVWSIAVPIALAELLVPDRAREPWLGRTGLVLTAVVYVLGCLEVFAFMFAAEEFLATPGQMIGAAAVAAVLVVAAWRVPRRREPAGRGWVPRPRVLGAAVFAGLVVYQLRPETWGGFAFGIAWLVLLGTALVPLARRRRFGARHELAVVAAALAVYALLGPVLTLMTTPDDPLRWVGNAVFAGIAVVLVLIARARTRPRVDAATPPG
ncbi:hypothetical protein [Pseudonocardia humida]|uniref:Uncharacterized protein n=1 Tax=Pseudonocardia humida TaxID=2800819 RepID=A0ABT1ACB1_9PSEU|nr:hypothetical protein [Pseudonocardia humida]MCO1660434.1 hypothetical protein [Pseudonocardia humida]